MSKRKYALGKKIESVAEFEKSDFTFFKIGIKTYHRGWLESFQYRVKKISLKLKGGNKTSFKKGHKPTPEAIAKQVKSSKKQMAIKRSLFENYKNEMTWNQFQTFYRTHKHLFDNKAGSNVLEGGNGKTKSHNEN